MKMDGEIIAFPTNCDSRTEEPAGELRWLERPIIVDGNIEMRRTLQMLWSETIFNDGHPVRGGVFWRDVPTIEGDT